MPWRDQGVNVAGPWCSPCAPVCTGVRTAVEGEWGDADAAESTGLCLVFGTECGARVSVFRGRGASEQARVEVREVERRCGR